jgi:multicomponent Na+:H+ antiporter subunit B
MFAAAVVPLAAFLGWGVSGLAPFGFYPGPYGDIINAIAEVQRHVTNAATAVNFDYRGFDTLGEEFIFFTSVAGLVLILRERREQGKSGSGLEDSARADGIGTLSLAFLPIIVVFGLYMAVHGPATPGGGFQGGAIIGSGFLLAYLGSGHDAFTAIGDPGKLDPLEALGAGAYVIIGLVAVGMGLSYLQNYMPLGSSGNTFSGGTIWAVNMAVMLEIATGFGVAIAHFLKEIRG